MLPLVGPRALASGHAPEPGSVNPGLIDRADLVTALDRAVKRKVTIISAPPGSGKTSLLSAWADRSAHGNRLAVVPVNRDERDAQQYWLGLLSAVRRAKGAASTAEPPAATPAFNGRALVDRVLAELADADADADGDIVLVIDDLHELNCPEALAQLTRLLLNLPANAHAVLATRRDLRLHLHRLRLAGELTEIRAADLRFTARETRELLDVAGITLSDAGAALLHHRTEGWAAGLRLAILALADHADPERFVAEFSGNDRTVAEYLVAEMLERQPEDVQHLLLCTSLLDQVNGELGDLLTGRTGSERILLELEDANALVVSLDPPRTWFRYHHLFADLLRLELRRTSPEAVPTLHRRAAAWFLQRGQAIESVRHTQAAGDWPDAARLLTDHAFSLMLDGHAQTLQALVQAFPQGADHPELALVRATIDLVHGRLDDATAQLAAAEASCTRTAPPERLPRIRLTIASLKLWLARRRGQLADVLEQATFLTTDHPEGIAVSGDLRAAALMNLGIAEAWSVGTPDGERHLLEGALLARELGRPYLEVSCLAQLGFASKFRSYAAVRSICQEAVALAERHGWGTEPMISPALVTLAANLVFTGEFDEAERWLGRAEQVLQSDTGPEIRTLHHMVTGMLHAGRGRQREALTEFDTVQHLQSLLGPHTLASMATGWRLATQARLGMSAAARATLAALPDQSAAPGEIRNARAVIALADGQPHDALDALRDVVDRAAPVIGDITVIESHLLAAHAHRQLGDQRKANLSVEEALTLAEPDRLVLPFALTGSRELLEALPRHATAHAALLTSILDVMHGNSPAIARRSSSTSVEELSPSELRVLRYLPTNLSRPEIASELSVSVNTVNTHVRNIYAKLQAHDRSSAVQRARELRLLSAGLPR